MTRAMALREVHPYLSEADAAALAEEIAGGTTPAAPAQEPEDAEDEIPEMDDITAEEE
jgi:hypothetical protein